MSETMVLPLIAVVLCDAGDDPKIGPEDGVRPHDGIACYVSPHGSYRYVYYVDGLAVSGLQLVSRDGRAALTANAFTLEDMRRRGYCRRLFQAACYQFERIDQSPHTSLDGAKWVAAVGEWPVREITLEG